MRDEPYLVLHTHFSADELRPHMQDSATLMAFVVRALQARGFLLRSMEDYDGTLQGQVDTTADGMWVRQILPRPEASA